jgi:hypothetical protein
MTSKGSFAMPMLGKSHIQFAAVIGLEIEGLPQCGLECCGRLVWESLQAVTVSLGAGSLGWDLRGAR